MLNLKGIKQFVAVVAIVFFVILGGSLLLFHLYKDTTRPRPQRQLVDNFQDVAEPKPTMATVTVADSGAVVYPKVGLIGTASGGPDGNRSRDPDSHTGTDINFTSKSTANNKTTSRCGSVELKWTSLKAGKDNKTAFLSAYFDDRKGVANRPAVIVLGYQWKSLKNLELHCVFTFKNSSTFCSSKPVRGVGNYCLNHFDGDKAATSYAYVCPMDCGDSGCSNSEIPVSVSMSVSSKCVNQSESIIIQDCRPNMTSSTATERKRVAVCPSSPMYEVGRQEIVEFIEMNRALGVDLMSLYLMSSIDQKTIQYLKEHYDKDKMLEMFKWNIVKKWNPLHYFGQLLSVHDCMYRNMYRVDYIIVEDLDELIIPLKHDSYTDMIDSLNTNAHSYRFHNHFFAVNTTKQPLLPNCGGTTLPKYFHRTDHFECGYGISYRPKYMFKPKYVINLDVHNVCDALPGKKQSDVPSSVAILGHYRNSIPGDCKRKSTSQQLALMKFQSKVTQGMCSM